MADPAALDALRGAFATAYALPERAIGEAIAALALVALAWLWLRVRPAAPSRLAWEAEIARGPERGSRSKLAAALLALFLGGLGLHRFYLGRPLSGVVYLVFCWTFVPALIGLVEGLWLLTISERRFAAIYP